MIKPKTKKPGTKGSKHHGNVSGRKGSMAPPPQDQVGAQMKTPDRQTLGTQPSPFPSANVPMSGGQYPGSEVGA